MKPVNIRVTPEAQTKVLDFGLVKAFGDEGENTGNQADYLMVGPRAMLEVAQPLLDWRREQGLEVMAVPVEDVYQEFGFGETVPKAGPDFLAYAYHQWSSPSPRHVVLLGDATLDPKDYLETGVTNQVLRAENYTR